MNHTIRLKGIKFSRSQAGPQEREFRSGSGLSFLSEDMHNEILTALGADADAESVAADLESGRSSR